MNDLKSIGYSNWFESRENNEKMAVHDVARVVSVHKESYSVTKGGEDIFETKSVSKYKIRVGILQRVVNWFA